MKEGRGRVNVIGKRRNAKGSGTIYIEQDVFFDSTFPFKAGDEVDVKIVDEVLLIKKKEG